MYLSGTHAPIGQRVALIRRLLNSGDHKLELLGLQALEATLRIGQFTSSHDFSFGARSRNFGWQPKTKGDFADWYRMAIGLAAEIALGNSSHHQRARDMIAHHFRMLWVHAGINDELERVARKLVVEDGWPDGWIAVRLTIRYHAEKMPAELIERLRRLEVDLHPRDLVQKVRAYVLSNVHGGLDLADAEVRDDSGASLEASWKRMQLHAEALGEEVAGNPEIFKKVLPETLRNRHGRQDAFGRGLAMKAPDIHAMWKQICDALASIEERERNVAVLRGYIAVAMEREPDTANRLLDEAITHPLLGPSFPALQASMRVDEAGAARIVTSLTAGLAPAWMYKHLSYGRASDNLSSSTFKKIMLAVANLPDGFSTAVDVLCMRLYILKNDKLEIDPETLTLGQELLAGCRFQDRDSNLSYHMSEIAKACLQGAGAKEAAKAFCGRFAAALADHNTSAWQYEDLAKTLFQIQPKVALDVFLHTTEPGHSVLSPLISIEEDGGPVNEVPEEQLRAWAEEDSASRFVTLAREIRLLAKRDPPEEWTWTPLALHLIEKAPSRADVLKEFSWRLHPRSWSGSLADVLTPYLQAVRKLSDHDDPVVREWVIRQADYLTRQIEQERQQERRADETFE